MPDATAATGHASHYRRFYVLTPADTTRKAFAAWMRRLSGHPVLGGACHIHHVLFDSEVPTSIRKQCDRQAKATEEAMIKVAPAQ